MTDIIVRKQDSFGAVGDLVIRMIHDAKLEHKYHTIYWDNYFIRTVKLAASLFHNKVFIYIHGLHN